MKTERFDAKDEIGVTHKFTREVVDEAANKAAKDSWNKYDAKQKGGFEVVSEKWGYSVRNTKAGSKMADIYAENDYSVVNYYFPDEPQYSTTISYSVGYGSSSGEGAREGIREKVDPLNDSGINYCVKESLYKPHSSAE